MKTTRNDPFDLDLCIRALGNQLTYMHTDIYLFMYSMSFKSSGKPSDYEFEEELYNFNENMEFFMNCDNSFVKACCSICITIINYKVELCSKWGIKEQDDLENEMISEDALRYNPRYLGKIKRKNFLKLSLSYLKTLEGIVKCLYAYLGAVTIESYKIPMAPKQLLNLYNKHYLKGTLGNEIMARFIVGLISEIMEPFEDYQDAADRGHGILKMMGVTRL